MIFASRKYGIFALVLFCLGIVGGNALAAEKKEACVKQQDETAWFAPIATSVTLMSGSELNAVVGGDAKFQPYLTYAVFVRENNQVNILTLSPRAMGFLPLFETQVEDQHGKKWMIKSDYWLCY